MLTTLLFLSSTYGVSLSRDSYSAEMALAQLDTAQMGLIPCLCFKYNDQTQDTAAAAAIASGGIIELSVAEKCVSTDAPATSVRRADVTNQSCLYKLWMCACWASGTEGCLCAKEVNGD